MIEFRNTGYFVKDNGDIIGKRNTLKQTITPDGYYSVCLYFNGKSKTFLSHRIIAECYIPNPENKSTINHKDGNKLNNHISNLEWNTQQENIEHFYTKLSKRTIGNHPNSKLSYDDVLEIYKWYNTHNIYQNEIAKKYNVCRTTISKALKKLQNK